MRWEVLNRFEAQIEPFMSDVRSVAVVGGSPNEPELKILERKLNLLIDYFGVDAFGIPDNSFTFLDLNKITELEKSYDLVICSQVLEHIWQHSNAFENLAKLVDDNGLIWIGCPASNYAHGSPNYYSAGFTPEFIANHLEANNFKILFGEAIGSKRYYFLTHILQVWASERMHRYPLFSDISRYFPKEAFMRFNAIFISSRVGSNMKWATETVVFAKKSAL